MTRAATGASVSGMGQQTVGSRHPEETVDAIDADAARLDLDRSAWMRMAVDRTLTERVKRSEAAAYREQPRAKRSDAGQRRNGAVTAGRT